MLGCMGWAPASQEDGAGLCASCAEGVAEAGVAEAMDPLRETIWDCGAYLPGPDAISVGATTCTRQRRWVGYLLKVCNDDYESNYQLYYQG